MPWQMMMRTLLARLTIILPAFLAPAGAWSAELLMVERAGCIWCARWDRDVAPIYVKSDEARVAPLRRFSLDNGQPPVRLKEPVRFTPTFILLEDDAEVGRITGYLDDSMFWGLLGKMLERLGQPTQGK